MVNRLFDKIEIEEAGSQTDTDHRLKKLEIREAITS
jgi:hypothetical protein